MRNAPLTLGLAAVLVFAAAVLVIAVTTTSPATASHLCNPAAPTPPDGPGAGGCGMDAISVDTDTTGNTATTVTTIENCIQVAAGASVTLDITAQGIPAFDDAGDGSSGLAATNDSGGLFGYGFDLGYDSTALSVTAVDVNFMLGVNAGSSIFNAGETAFPDTDGTYSASAVDTGTTIPESGSGVLERVTIAVSGTAPTGQYTLLLSNVQHLDATGTGYLPDVINFGAIAVGQACSTIATPTPEPTLPPTPTPSPTPVPTPSPSPSPSPTPSPTPCNTNCPTPSPSPSPTLAAGAASPSRTPTRAATPAALPPTGSQDSSGPAAPIVLGAASVIVIAMALGGYEITRRMKREV